MSAVRLYFDADSMQRVLLVALHVRDVDATTALEAGMADRTDEEQLEFARSQGRVLVTFNVSHFCRIHSDLLSEGSNMSTEIISITVDADAARSFGEASPEERRKLELLLRLRLRELTLGRIRSLKEIMDEIGTDAEAQGLTLERLESMLREE
jgi:hypothetical protein